MACYGAFLGRGWYECEPAVFSSRWSSFMASMTASASRSDGQAFTVSRGHHGSKRFKGAEAAAGWRRGPRQNHELENRLFRTRPALHAAAARAASRPRSARSLPRKWELPSAMFASGPGLPLPHTQRVAAGGGFGGFPTCAAAARARTQVPSASSRSRLLLSCGSFRARRHLYARRGARQ